MKHTGNTAPGQTARETILAVADDFANAGLFFGHGTECAVDEAAALVTHVLGQEHNQPGDSLKLLPTKQQLEQIRQLANLRIDTRKPLAYLTRTAWFAGLPFYVDENVLVPRSPIAELIGDRFSPWLAEGEPCDMLDLCAGSGCIGIACAQAFPAAHVDIADISPAALSVARRNVVRHQLEGRVNLIESDLLSGLKGRQYDLIVSNPPYVSPAELKSLPPEYRHEPSLGLVSGDDGMSLVTGILKDAPDYLTEKGILVLEVGHSQPVLEALFPDVPFLWLDFEHGGEGVLLFDCQQLKKYRPVFEREVDNCQANR